MTDLLSVLGEAATALLAVGAVVFILGNPATAAPALAGGVLGLGAVRFASREGEP